MNIFKQWPALLLSALGLGVGLAGSAYAGLQDFDRGPYTPASGNYPLWYMDEENVTLELCRTRATSSRTGGNGLMCLIAPEGDEYNENFPMIFPDNWPGELFWFIAEASIPVVNGYGLEVYTAALEAAFAEDEPVDGDQVVFGRIRIRANIPQTGVYTITHPYGVDVINVTTTGRRAINMTRDLGIGAPGDYSGALTSDIGPFLHSVNGPYMEVEPETGNVATFVGDPNLSEEVTGSAFDTNFVRIEGPAGTIQTNLFSVSGKVFDQLQPIALEVERASYKRNANGTRVEVFAGSNANAEVCFRESLALVGDPGSPCLINMVADGNGRFFAHNSNPDELPDVVVVTASDPSGVYSPSSSSKRLIDVVKVDQAHYSWADNSLSISARSSDEQEVPDLFAEGYGRLSKSGVLQTLVIEGLSQPPASIRVVSSAGGSDSELVSISGQAPDMGGNQPPVAVNDSAQTSAGVPVLISVLANDSDPDGDLPLSVVSLTQPDVGSVALSGSTAVVYTPPASVDGVTVTSFTYRARDIRGAESEPATVTVTINPNQPPVAVNDSAISQANTITIDVLANDSDPENNVPLSVVNLTQPPAGQGSVSTDGSIVTYVPPATVTSTFTTSFTYQAMDTLGAVSNVATVSVEVRPPPAVGEVINVTQALLRERSNDRHSWELRGTTSQVAGNTISVEVATVNGPFSLGNATLTPTGQWRISANTTGLTPTTPATATIRSALGTVLTVELEVR